MRVFHVVATDQEWGGLERSVVELAKIQNGVHEVKVGGAPVVLDRLPAAVARVVLPMGLSRRDPRLLWKLGRALRDFKPDIIHAHANKAASLISTLRPWIPRAATVATVQNTKRSVKVFARFDQVIAVSRKAGLSLGKIPHTVIWNAIPRSTPPADMGDCSALPFLGKGRPVIAAVGRLVPAKGFDILLEAMRSLEADLWIIGDGPLRGELEAQAKTTGVADRVWFAGFRSDVDRLMCLADLMVISSRHEGFPFVFVEMLHLRRPVVGTRVAGVEEVLPAEWLCDTCDAGGLATLIKKALARGASLASDQAAIFDFAAEELSLDHTLPKIEAVYRAACDDHS